MKLRCPDCGRTMFDIQLVDDHDRELFTDEELSNDEKVINTPCSNCRSKKANDSHII